VDFDAVPCADCRAKLIDGGYAVIYVSAEFLERSKGYSRPTRFKITDNGDGTAEMFLRESRDEVEA
jgi:hypothetical protein